MTSQMKFLKKKLQSIYKKMRKSLTINIKYIKTRKTSMIKKVFKEKMMMMRKLHIMHKRL